MSGIPVYTQSPINPAKASGITPKTAVAPVSEDGPTKPSYAPATTTAIPSSTYPSARPGAVAVSSAPAPTGSASQRYSPVHPTPTTKLPEEGPPAPQPGAFPTPDHNSKGAFPPPPKAGEHYQLVQQAIPQPYPPQMAIPPPTNVYGAQPPSSSTTTANTSTLTYLAPVQDYEAPRRSLEHPPGYLQNPYASNFSADQRRAYDAQEQKSEGSLGGFRSNSPTSKAAFGVDPEAVWNTAKKWASSAGQKLQETEEMVWKKVNGEN